MLVGFVLAELQPAFDDVRKILAKRASWRKAVPQSQFVVVGGVCLWTVLAVYDLRSRKISRDQRSQIAVSEVEHVRNVEQLAVGGPVVEYAVDKFGQIVGA